MFFRPNFRDSNSLTIVMNDYDDDGDGRHKSRQDQVWSMGLTWEKNQIKSRKGPRKITKNNFLSPSLLHQINQNSRTIKPNSFDNEIFNFKFCFSRILFPFFFCLLRNYFLLPHRRGGGGEIRINRDIFFNFLIDTFSISIDWYLISIFCSID